MHVPTPFRLDDRDAVVAAIRATRLPVLVTSTDAGLMATPVPLLYDADDGPHGAFTGHLSRANPQVRHGAVGDALVILAGPDAYVTPSWYPSKQATGEVVPTWNYVHVHAFGPLETFDDPDRLLEVVARLTDREEAGRAAPWAVADAPESYVDALLRAIVGVRIPVTRVEAKAKLSQNRSDADRLGVRDGLAASHDAGDRAVAAQMQRDP